MIYGINKMRVIVVSNYFNHHQQPLCEILKDKCESFFFISTSVMREERKKLGYTFDEPEYVIKALDEKEIQRAKAEISNADVIIYGSAVGELSKSRYYFNKTIFYYSERIYKTGCKYWMLPIRAIQFYYKYRWRRKSCLLCAGAYTAYDYSLSKSFLNKYYKWGYFPKLNVYNLDEFFSNKEKSKILWCGRLIDWKHPELAVKAAAMLKETGYDFTLDIIGSGEMETELNKLIKNSNLEDTVRLLGSMPPAEVRQHMNKAGIFLMTSDKQEGWGAVLNEAMNSGCAVIAGSAIGSVPFLIENEKNGFIVKNDDVQMFYGRICELLKKPELIEKLGRSAYNTIASEWNAVVAADRLLSVADSFYKTGDLPNYYFSGPLSKAMIMGDNEFEFYS